MAVDGSAEGEYHAGHIGYLLSAESLGDIAESASEPLAGFVFGLILDRQGDLAVFGAAAHDGYELHPEYGSRSAEGDGHRHSYYVGGPYGRAEGCTGSSEGGYLAFFGFLEHLSESL